MLWVCTPASAAPFHPRTSSLDVSGLNHACGAAVDYKGDLYASSAGTGDVRVHDPKHVLLTSIPNAKEPCGLAVTTTGNLYVSERATGEVVRYKPNAYPFAGTPTYGPREVIDASGLAGGIAVDPSDNRLYVAEGTRVSVYDANGSLGTDEEQEVRCFQCTGSKYKLEFKGEPTGSIPFEGPAEEVKKALEGLASIDPGDISVINGSNSRIHLVTFGGKYAHSDIEALKCIPEALEGGGGQECKITEIIKGWSGHIGEGDLSEATGVAPYTYKATGSSAFYHLAVADASGDQLKLFSAASFKEQTLRSTLAGPEEGEEFGFGPNGAYLAADPGTCPPAGGNACTAGHLFLYDDANEVLDELEATGQLVSQTPLAAGDGAPTAIAVDRSGGEGNGTLYATSGAGAGARVLAFGALKAPGRSGPVESLSLTLAKTCSVAIDEHGNRYLAVGPEVVLYPPSGAKALGPKIPSPSGTLCRITVDPEGNVYALVTGAKEREVVYYKPSSFPPTEGTTYGAPVTVAKQGEFEGEPIGALAINPANGRLLVTNAAQTNEYKSAKEGSGALIAKFGDSLSLGTRESLAVCGRTGDVYVGTAGSGIFVLNAAGTEVLTQITGAGSPAGNLGNHTRSLAVNQEDGHPIAFEPSYKEAREFESTGTFVATFGSFEELVTTNFGVAVDNGSFSPNKGTAYVAYDDPKAKYDLAAFSALEYPPVTKHKLTLKKSGLGSGTVTSSPPGISCGATCSHEYNQGEGVVLTATPNPGSEFIKWTGCAYEPSPTTCEVTMGADTEVGAEFGGGPTNKLKVLPEGSGSGTVTSNPAGIDCPSECEAEFPKGEGITLTATADPGSEVENWEGCEEEPSPTECVVTMDEDKEVKVLFGPEHPLLLVTKEGTGTGTLSSEPPGIDCGSTCEAKFDLDEVVVLTAEADPGSEFEGWGAGDCEEETVSPAEGTCEVTMDGPGEVEATFTELPRAIARPPNPLGFSEAVLRGEVGTVGLKTEYRFEYLSEAQYEANGETFAGAKATPTEELKPAEALAPVSAPVSDLAEGTAYRLRLVVENEAGTAEDEASFTTLEEGGGGPPCPNAALRTGPSANLPDCRAYELVTPPQDGGYQPFWGGGSTANGTFGATALAAADGESVAFQTEGPLPGTEGNGVRNGYRATRGPGGWSLDLYGPTYAQTDFPSLGSVSTDQRFSFWAAQGESGILDPPEGGYARYLALPEAGADPQCTPKAEPTGRFAWIGCGSEGSDPEAIGHWISPNAAHVIFTSNAHLEPGAPAKSITAIYDRSPGGQTHVLSLLPDGKVPSESASYRGVSADGSAVAFSVGGTLYLRLDDAQTLEVGTGVTFAGLARDGSALFYLQGGALHRFDTAAGISTQIAPGGTFINVPVDGTSAYFTSKAALAPGAEAGLDNLYLWEAQGDFTSFVAILDPADLTGDVNLANWVKGLNPEGGGIGEGPAIDPSRSSADGQALLFESHAPLTNYDANGHTEVFRYDATGASLTCISCGPEGTTANSDSQLQDEVLGAAVITPLAPIANLSEDGRTAFFVTAEPLAPTDQNRVTDVYEWREERLSLISGGQSAYPSYLYAVSATGDDVFFTTRQALVSQDEEEASSSIYDARVGGGFPTAPRGGEGCEGEICLGPPSAPRDLKPAYATTSLSAEGVEKRTQSRKCPKGKHRVRRGAKVRCIKKHKLRKRHHQSPKADHLRR
ncbi:MAG TPA: hypothetical protein VF245_07795 [Solirubrobacterales bacterium]